MEEAILDVEMERIYKQMSFLWTTYGYHLKFFTRAYGRSGFIIGLENDVCKFLFEKEIDHPRETIRHHIGKKDSPFVPPQHNYWDDYGWYPLPGLIYWLSGVESERGDDIDQDLKFISQYLERHIDKVLELFKHPDEFDSKLEYYRNLYKDKQITVDQIKAERARLKALGQDWSLEAAINSLRGDKK
ncbi:MAG: hypothetical protein JW730_16310 [Anaerolineales bacterium]|nr:hypothetical protein [Anaerolineales bacterium]